MNSSCSRSATAAPKSSRIQSSELFSTLPPTTANVMNTFRDRSTHPHHGPSLFDSRFAASSSVFRVFLAVLAVSCGAFLNTVSFGQTTIGIQDFETSPATPTLTFTTSDNGSPGSSSGFSTGATNATADAPGSANLFVGGARGYRLQGPSSGTASRTLTFSSVDTTTYTAVSASFRVAGI